MAELNKIMFGNVKGKFGKAVFRQRNGLNYIAQRPSTYTAPANEAFLERTNKFKISSKIAKTISDSSLKELWLPKLSKGQSAYNYLISKNYPAVNGTTVNNLLLIVPNSRVGIRLNTSTLSTDKLSVSLKPLTESSLIDPDVEKKAQLCSLVFLSSPDDESIDPFDAFILFSSKQTFDLATGLSFEISLSTSDENKIAHYQSKSVHSTLLTFGEDDLLINYSSTF